MLPLIALTGWRYSLVIISVIAMIIMIPVILSLKPEAKKDTPKIQDSENGSKNLKGTKYFRSIKFWIISLNIFTLPFILTAVSLYQYSIGEMRGWSVSWVAFSFSFFAVSSAIGLLISGNLTDRFTGIFLFPLYLFPALLGVLLLSIFTNQYAFPVFWALAGFSSGLGSTVKTATQTEIYGAGSLGKVRSYFSTIIVLSTALGPPLLAFLLDRNISLQIIMAFSGIILLLTSIVSFYLWPDRYHRKMRAMIPSPLKVFKS
jgi:predicted MFS family arabinose efflux permease